jgi:WD40 repeat protein
MLEEDEIPDPKPLVEYGYLPEEKEDIKPDILDKYESKSRNPLDLQEFGRTKTIVDTEIIKEIHDFHKVKKPEDIFIPYDIDLEEDPGLVGPVIPQDFKSTTIVRDENDMDLSDDGADEEDQIDNRIPVTHVVDLEHTKNQTVNSMDLDRACNRLLTASHDGTVKIWDFSSMNRRPHAFHTVDAGETLPVNAVSWGPTGGYFLTATGDCQAKVFDRDGIYQIGCLKGDSYLHDISNTKGHTQPLTDGKWHPWDKRFFITSSRDSTVRVWDIESKPIGIGEELTQSHILRAKTFKNHKITVNCCNYSPDGSKIIGGVNDGSLQLWSVKGSYWKPDVYIKDAHKPNSEITAVLFADDGKKIFSRADDNTLRMWDTRMINRPIHTWDHIPCFGTKSGIALSPDESIIVTGTCVKRGHENSSLLFFSTYDYSKLKELKVCPNSISSILWSEKLDQIAVGTTDGTCRMYFNPTYSKHGIVDTIYKKAKTKEIDDFTYAMPIITPLVLPVFDESTFDRKTYLDIIKGEDEVSHKAELPVQGPGSKFQRPPSVTQFIMKSVHKTLYSDSDSRDALHKFASKNNGGDMVDPAYKNTQPKPVFDMVGPLEDEVKYYEQSKRRKCAGCGLKFCSCNKNTFALPIPKLSAPKKYKNF